MARPIKNGVKRFYLRTDLSSTPVYRELCATVGISGIGTLIVILSKIYAQGYELKVTDEFVNDIAVLVGKKKEQIKALIKRAVRLGIFDQKPYEDEAILTSEEIVKCYKRESNAYRTGLLAVLGIYATKTVNKQNDDVEKELTDLRDLASYVEHPADPTLKQLREDNKEIYAEVSSAYKEILGRYLPVPRVLTATRRTAIVSINTELNKVGMTWKEYFEKVRASPFLTGQNNRGWRANFDWLLGKKNLYKVIDGVFDRPGTRIDNKYVARKEEYEQWL